MQKFMHQGLYWSKVVVLGVILGVGIQFAEAWTNPTVSAPGGNVAGPLNTGVINQVKNASLGLVGNLAANMLQINGVATEGAACSSTGLVARDTGGMILSCQSGVWAKGMGSGALSGTMCGSVRTYNYSLVIGKNIRFRCDGHDPTVSCPAGFTRQIAYHLDYNTFYTCAKD